MKKNIITTVTICRHLPLKYHFVRLTEVTISHLQKSAATKVTTATISRQLAIAVKIDDQ